MRSRLMLLLQTVGLLFVVGAAAAADPPRTLIEIYRVAPGQHLGFVKFIALCDEANKHAGLPARQLYVHQDGGSWDFLVIQPVAVTPEQSKALETAFKRLKIPQGAKFFVTIRQFVAEHTDTVASGPTTAADWLSELQ